MCVRVCVCERVCTRVFARRTRGTSTVPLLTNSRSCAITKRRVPGFPPSHHRRLQDRETTCTWGDQASSDETRRLQFPDSLNTTEAAAAEPRVMGERVQTPLITQPRPVPQSLPRLALQSRRCDAIRRDETRSETDAPRCVPNSTTDTASLGWSTDAVSIVSLSSAGQWTLSVHRSMDVVSLPSVCVTSVSVSMDVAPRTGQTTLRLYTASHQRQRALLPVIFDPPQRHCPPLTCHIM